MFKNFNWIIIEKILEEIQIGLTFVDNDGNLLYFNHLAMELLGWSKDEIEKNSLLTCHPPDVQVKVLEKIRNTTKKEWHSVIKIKNKYIENIYSPINIPGQFTGVVIITRNVTEREEMIREIKNTAAELYKSNQLLKQQIEVRETIQKELQESEERFRTLVNSMNDIVFTLDKKHNIEVFGQWFEKGLNKDFFIGKSLYDILGSNEMGIHEPAINRALSGENVVYEWSIENQGETLHFQNSLSPIKNTNENVIGLVGVGRDITERKRTMEILQRLSSMDGLTGIANRRYFDDYLAQEWRDALQNAKPISLIMCDIDFFKAYNDTYGHLNGDYCLKQVASTIAATLNEPSYLVARYGGEEFAIILSDTDIKRAIEVAEVIRTNIESLKIAHINSQVNKYVTVSSGVATIIPENTAISVLINAADQALYKAKQNGRNRVGFNNEV